MELALWKSVFLRPRNPAVCAVDLLLEENSTLKSALLALLTTKREAEAVGGTFAEWHAESRRFLRRERTKLREVLKNDAPFWPDFQIEDKPWCEFVAYLPTLEKALEDLADALEPATAKDLEKLLLERIPAESHVVIPSLLALQSTKMALGGLAYRRVLTQS